jgi:hypothetical protein
MPVFRRFNNNRSLLCRRRLLNGRHGLVRKSESDEVSKY